MSSVKKYVNLIINACLSEPPSESLYFRYFTLAAKAHLDYEVLIESKRDMTDFYFAYLRERGMMDFVSEIIVPEYRVEGVRIDTELIYPKTILVKRISCENVLSLLGQVKLFKSI